MRRLEVGLDHFNARERREFKFWRGSSAHQHALKLLALTLAGDPKPDEPLREACRRTISHFGRDPDESSKWARDGFDGDMIRTICLALTMGDISPESLLESKSASMPPWLLAFTRADLTASQFGLTVPIRIEDQIPGREAIKEMCHWPALPQCAFIAGGPMTADEYRAAWAAQCANGQE
jgi:hypothetical protein